MSDDECIHEGEQPCKDRCFSEMQQSIKAISSLALFKALNTEVRLDLTRKM